MAIFKLTTHNPEETQRLAEDLAKILKPNAIICLYGDLGTGKTTFVKGMAKALKIKEADIQSPTFVLMRVYKGKLPIYHFDLYRLEDMDEIKRLGMDDYLYDEGISLIEWADRLGENVPKDHIRIDLKHKKEDERFISVKSFGRDSEKYVTTLKKKYS